jgi:selenocysteine-specific elongation factor
MVSWSRRRAQDSGRPSTSVGVVKDEVVRGQVLASPGSFRPTTVLDVRVRLLPGAPPLAHHDRIRFYLRSDEVMGRTRLLDRERLSPGDAAVAQVRLERATVAARGDPFVLRRYSPMVTLGGGEVIAPHAPLRRRGAASAQAVTSRETSGLDAQVTAAVAEAGRSGTTVDALARGLGAVRDRIAAQAASLLESRAVLHIRGRLFARSVAEDVREAILRTLRAHHAATPWRIGMPRDDLKSRAFGARDDRLYGEVFDALVADGRLAVRGGFASLAEWTPQRTPADAAAASTLEDLYRRGRFTPPGREDALAHLPDRASGDRMFQALLDEGTLVDAGGGIVFHRAALEEIESHVVTHIKEHGEITVASLRDQLGSSRKFALTVLEYFDTRRLTRRVGDKRILAHPPATS